MTVPAVFCFDLDDTLVSESDYVESGLRVAGMFLDAAVPTHESAAEWLVAEWRRERRRDVFQALLARRGLAMDPWLQRMKDAFRSHAPALRAREGVLETLAAIVARGTRLALISDGYLDVQRRKWAALSLPFRFQPVVFTDERGPAYWKPNPWAFERVMSAHPGAGRFLFIGDNPAKDFLAANRLGWMTVMVRDPRNVHPPLFDARDAGAPRIVLDSFLAVAGLL